jgi:hypothetical protein
MVTAILLTFLAVICRLCSAHFQVWNFVPMGAVALYAGARLPRKWAWMVPVAAMILSDMLLDYGRHRPTFEYSRLLIYATFALTTLLGPVANRPKSGAWWLPALSLLASVLFFLTSNFGTWAEGQLYPMTPAGLWSCYIAGLLFVGFKWTILADLVGTGLLFCLGSLIERAFQRSTPAELAAERVQ